MKLVLKFDCESGEYPWTLENGKPALKGSGVAVCCGGIATRSGQLMSSSHGDEQPRIEGLRRRRLSCMADHLGGA